MKCRNVCSRDQKRVVQKLLILWIVPIQILTYQLLYDIYNSREASNSNFDIYNSQRPNWAPEFFPWTKLCIQFFWFDQNIFYLKFNFQKLPTFFLFLRSASSLLFFNPPFSPFLYAQHRSLRCASHCPWFTCIQNIWSYELNSHIFVWTKYTYNQK